MSAHSSGTPEGERRRSVRPVASAAPAAEPASSDVHIDDDSDLALELLRELADQETARAERAVARARQAFALAAGFFAVVQTVVFGTFAGQQITPDERRQLLVLAAIAGGLLVVCGVLLLLSDRAFRGRNLTPDLVLDALNDARGAGGSVKDRFISLYATLVDELRHTNKYRLTWVFITQFVAFISLVAVLAELLFGLDARQSR